MAPGLTKLERTIILVVAAAQFVNVLEFVVVMPLGPDYQRALDIPTAHLPYVAAAYTGTAALAGIVGALFLDRFDRRRALLVTLGGLVVCTATAGLVTSFPLLIAARAAAGAFGGPATSVSMSIVADAVPNERRGRAFSIVLLAFSMAATFGVPAALELARRTTWRMPFFAIAGLGVVAVALTTRLPSLTSHIRSAPASPLKVLGRLLGTPLVRRSYLMTIALQTSGFLLVPNLSPYIQNNLGFPRAHLAWLYLVGGVASFVATRTAGRFVDRYGSLRTATVGLAGLVVIIAFAFARPISVMAVPFAFCAYMVAMALRNVAYNTLASKVPAPEQRASFQSLQSTVTHASIALGSATAAHVLSTGPHGELTHMPTLAWIAIALSALIPLLMWRVERGTGPGR